MGHIMVLAHPSCPIWVWACGDTVKLWGWELAREVWNKTMSDANL